MSAGVPAAGAGPTFRRPSSFHRPESPSMRRFPPLFLALLMVAPAAGAQSAPAVDPRVDAALARVSPDSLRVYLERLVSFGTRHTLSADLAPDRGIVPAREYILERFRGFSPRLVAELDCYRIPEQGRITAEAELCNVVAILPGRSERRIYVSGHFDTVARRQEGGFDWSRWDNPAPGANDDGSGTVLTMELARVLSQSGIDFDATLVFVAFAGEEEGLVGATLHAQRAVRDSLEIEAVFNHDIIGNSLGGNGIVDSRTVRVFAEGPEDSMSRQMARHVRRWAAAYVPSTEVRPIAREDRFGRGGDHTAFNRLGFAGVRFSESRENYSRQHTAADTLEGVDFEYLARNTRVSGASVATTALAPATPVVDLGRGPMLGRGESGYDAHLRWVRSEGATAYRVVWRDTWSMDWQHEVVVGDVDEWILADLSIDDYVFGVAAVGPEGHESLVRPYVRAPRAFTPVEEIR